MITVNQKMKTGSDLSGREMILPTLEEKKRKTGG